MSGSSKDKSSSSKDKKKSSGSSGKKKSKSKKSSKSSKRRVKFSNEVACQFIMTLDEYTEDELTGSWYTPDEYGEMENECDTTATDFLDHKKPLPPHLCGRGLECWTLEGEKVKEQNVATGMDYVWDAQLEHWNKYPPGETKSSKDEINNSLANIATSYLPISRPCHEAASQVGKQDEKAVQSYLTVARSIEQTRRRVQAIGGSKAKGSKRIVRRAPSNSAKAKPKPAPRPVTPPPDESGYATPTSDDDTKRTEKTPKSAKSRDKGDTGKESKSSKKKSSKEKEKDSGDQPAKPRSHRRISFRPNTECPLSPGASINSYKSEVSASKIARGHHRRSLQNLMSSESSLVSEGGTPRRRARSSRQLSC